MQTGLIPADLQFLIIFAPGRQIGRTGRTRYAVQGKSAFSAGRYNATIFSPELLVLVSRPEYPFHQMIHFRRKLAADVKHSAVNELLVSGANSLCGPL